RIRCCKWLPAWSRAVSIHWQAVLSVQRRSGSSGYRLRLTYGQYLERESPARSRATALALEIAGSLTSEKSIRVNSYAINLRNLFRTASRLLFSWLWMEESPV